MTRQLVGWLVTEEPQIGEQTKTKVQILSFPNAFLFQLAAEEEEEVVEEGAKWTVRDQSQRPISLSIQSINLLLFSANWLLILITLCGTRTFSVVNLFRESFQKQNKISLSISPSIYLSACPAYYVITTTNSSRRVVEEARVVFQWHTDTVNECWIIIIIQRTNDPPKRYHPPRYLSGSQSVGLPTKASLYAWKAREREGREWAFDQQQPNENEKKWMNRLPGISSKMPAKRSHCIVCLFATPDMFMLLPSILHVQRHEKDKKRQE